MVDIAQVNNLLAGNVTEEPQQEEATQQQQEELPLGDGEDRIDELVQEEQEEQETEQEVDKEQEDITLENLKQFADYLGIQPEEAYGIEIPMPHGEPPLTISALKDEVVAARQNKQQFENERRQFQEQVSQFQQQANTIPQLSEEMLNIEAAMRAIDAQITNTKWDEIEDAGQAALYRQQLNDARQQLQGKKQEVIQREQQATRQAFLEQANADWVETVRVIPEWQNGDTVKQDKVKIKNHFNEYGFTDQEIFGLTDPRILRVLRDFTLLKERTNKQNIEAKKVIRKGVTVPNRQRTGISDSQKAQLAGKINKAKKTQDRRDIADAVTNLLNISEG